MKKGCILIVDDDVTARDILRHVLEAEGYEVVEAEDGKDALRQLESGPNRIGLVITDRSMPQMDGLELLKQLRDMKNPIPAIMVSAFGEEGLWGEAVRHGAIDYLLKPFKNEDLLRLVRKTFYPESKKGK